MIISHNLGFPKAPQNQTAQAVWQQQEGSDLLSVGCSNVADPMQTMMDLLGHQLPKESSRKNAPWFGSQLRSVVPEFTQESVFNLNAKSLIKEIALAKKEGVKTKPVVVGPISYLWFGEVKDKVNKLDLLDKILPVYAELLNALSSADIEWIQFDEPVLAQELDEDWKHALLQTYFQLNRSPLKKLLANSFGKLGSNLSLLRELTVDGVHLDTISAEEEALKVVDWLPNYKIISLAVVDGSQASKTNIETTLNWLKPLYDLIGQRLWLAPSCSLMHMADVIDDQTRLEKSVQKIAEIKQLAASLVEDQEFQSIKL